MLAASRAWRNRPYLGYRLFLQLLLPHAHGELGRSRCRTDCGKLRNRASGPRCQRHRPRGNWQPLANLSASHGTRIPGTHSSPRAAGRPRNSRGNGSVGAAVDRILPFPDALVKTGTAPCTHSPRAPGDGFAIVLTHADQPKILLMVRVHGVPGAQAAKTAGLMLRRVEGSFKE